ncbi:helix-turn-helix transcriptional regulator [Crossiella cryophila]|uniref:ATP/maltotriose-dependent transcriptional regulator MalT n=1 Tax=Crossiella cryophila TaxID=43355 RepID=A0A7W7FWF4_9PSEU|nr:LuxR family transcriptional regulator [Crossiella cryophila]MBB4680000.1 ATP/maltotriose-dependent transcriptional regulator MalT [Crossiella cryophila]
MQDWVEAAAGPVFCGRDGELARLFEVFDRVPAGRPQTVWVVGPAGIGKTTLVRRALAGPEAPEFTVLDATADPAESVLAFGLVEQLLRRVDPALRRSAPVLAGAVPAGASPFAVGAELLAVLSVLQADRPVALVVDDVHWADPASARAFGFLLRRMGADQVLTVLIRRGRAEYDPENALHQLERGIPAAVTLELGGLTGAEVGALSLALRGQALPGGAAERLCAHAGGNPLHIRTLLHELPPDVLDDEQLPLPVPSSLVTAVRAMLDRLPEPTRALLAALAVLDEDSPLARAAGVAGIEDAATAIGPGLVSGLLSQTARQPSRLFRITHGLQREAIYDLIPVQRRVALHRRAAEVTDPVSGWAHRVAATTAADPTLAEELDAAAAVAATLGQHLLAARYLRWAAELSGGRADYERRLLTCCVQTLFGPERRSALALRAEADRCAPSALRSLALGLVAVFAQGDLAGALRHLTEAMDRCTDDGWVRSVTAAGLAGAHTWNGANQAAIDAARLALRLGGLPVRLADFVRVLLVVSRSRLDGLRGGLAEFADLPTDPARVPPERLDSLACRGALRTMLGRFAEAEPDLREAARLHRAGVYTLSSATPHSYLAAINYVRGDWDDASILVHQALSLADPDEQQHHHVLRQMIAALVPAGRGEWATAAAHVRAAWAHAHRLGTRQDRCYAAIAEATLHQAQDRPADMLTALRALRRDQPAPGEGAYSWWELWWRPLLVEALTGTGAHAEATEALNTLRALAAGVDYLAPTLLRLDLALDGGQSGAAEQIDALDARAPRRSFGQALLEAGHGRWLAGNGQVARAVPYLTSARERFAELRATPFEQRTAALLEQHAPSAAPRTGTAVPGLSRREGQVAHLVRLNHTNREIAAQLYVTAKTVEYHLANIFLKLGVANRRELRDRLTPRTAPDIPAQVGPPLPELGR